MSIRSFFTTHNRPSPTVLKLMGFDVFFNADSESETEAPHMT